MPCEDMLDSRAGQSDILAVCSYESNGFQSFNIREHLKDLELVERAREADFLFVVSLEC